MPTPGENERRDEFIARCVPIVLEEGTAESQEQAVAICNSMWEQSRKRSWRSWMRGGRQVFDLWDR